MPIRGTVWCSEEQNGKVSGFCELVESGHGSNIYTMEISKCHSPQSSLDKEVPAHLSFTLCSVMASDTQEKDGEGAYPFCAHLRGCCPLTF